MLASRLCQENSGFVLFENYKINLSATEGSRHTNDTIETMEIWTDGRAVTVFWTVTGLGSGKVFCTKYVKNEVNEEIRLVEIDMGEEIINPRKGADGGCDVADEGCDAATSVDVEEEA